MASNKITRGCNYIVNLTMQSTYSMNTVTCVTPCQLLSGVEGFVLAAGLDFTELCCHSIGCCFSLVSLSVVPSLQLYS